MSGAREPWSGEEPLWLEEASAALEEATAEEILAEAVARFAAGLTFATGFGVEGTVLLEMIARARHAIDLFTLDTGELFPETRALWRRLEEQYGLEIRSVAADGARIARQIAEEGAEPWLRNPDGCCELRKLEPMRGALAGKRAWISGVRRDQASSRGRTRPLAWDTRFRLVKVSPLWRWTERDVWRRVKERAIPYNPLHDEGYPSIGCAPCTTPIGLGEDPRAGRWRGRSNKECGLHLPAVVPGSNEDGTLPIDSSLNSEEV